MSELQQGGTVEAVRKLMEDLVPAAPVEVFEPGTGIAALTVLSAKGVSPLPASIFDDYRTQPKHRKGTARLTSLDSIIAHVDRFKDEDSALFADDNRTTPSITAVIDYHKEGVASEGGQRFGHHRAVYEFAVSDEWKAWAAQDGKPMGMADFAAFIEERAVDVLHLIAGEDELPEDLQRHINTMGNPAIATPQQLVELSRGLQVYENAVVKEAVNLSSGEGQVVFESAHVDGKGEPLKVPGFFLIGVPVFQRGAFYRIAARLRYRKTPGGLLFFYNLWRVDRVFDHALTEGCQRVASETGLPLFFGKPE